MIKNICTYIFLFQHFLRKKKVKTSNHNFTNTTVSCKQKCACNMEHMPRSRVSHPVSENHNTYRCRRRIWSRQNRKFIINKLLISSECQQWVCVSERVYVCVCVYICVWIDCAIHPQISHIIEVLMDNNDSCSLVIFGLWFQHPDYNNTIKIACATIDNRDLTFSCLHL